MAIDDKHLDLKEARRGNKLGAFIREHSSGGDETKFDKLLNAMARGTRRANMRRSR